MNKQIKKKHLPALLEDNGIYVEDMDLSGIKKIPKDIEKVLNEFRDFDSDNVIVKPGMLSTRYTSVKLVENGDVWELVKQVVFERELVMSQVLFEIDVIHLTTAKVYPVGNKVNVNRHEAVQVFKEYVKKNKCLISIDNDMLLELLDKNSALYNIHKLGYNLRENGFVVDKELTGSCRYTVKKDIGKMLKAIKASVLEKKEVVIKANPFQTWEIVGTDAVYTYAGGILSLISVYDDINDAIDFGDRDIYLYVKAHIDSSFEVDGFQYVIDAEQFENLVGVDIDGKRYRSFEGND